MLWLQGVQIYNSLTEYCSVNWQNSSLHVTAGSILCQLLITFCVHKCWFAHFPLLCMLGAELYILD